jgi:hypothetical protein
LWKLSAQNKHKAGLLVSSKAANRRQEVLRRRSFEGASHRLVVVIGEHRLERFKLRLAPGHMASAAGEKKNSRCQLTSAE